MTVRMLAGFAGIAAITMLAACADDEPDTVAVVTSDAAVCEPLPGVNARVADSRPVYYGGTFDPGYVAVTDTSAIGQGDPNAIQYVVVTENGQQLPLLTREKYRRGDQLYIEADTCDRARVTVIRELG